MSCCYIYNYSQENDEATLSSVPERANKHSRKRKPAKQLQLRGPKREKYGSGEEFNERFFKNKTTSSSSTQSFQSGESDSTCTKCDNRKEKKSKFELNDQPSRSILPNWDKLFDDEDPLTYDNEIQQQCLRSSKSSPTISAFNPKQVDDISDLTEEAKPNINILPNASPPLTVPDQSFHNILPNQDYLLDDRNTSSNEDEIQQQCPRRAECSLPVPAFDPIRIIDFSDINEQAETNMNILFDATPSLFFSDQPIDITLPNWDGNLSIYGNEIQQQCFKSPNSSYNISDFSPMGMVDIPDMKEQAKPNMNFVPGTHVTLPSMLSVRASHSIFPNLKYSSHPVHEQQLLIMNTKYSPSTSAFDPMQIVDSSDISEQAKPNINNFPDAPPPPVLPI